MARAGRGTAGCGAIRHSIHASSGRWIKRLAEHGRGGILLLHARCETDYFEIIWARASAILFMADRVNFHRPDGSRQPANSGAPLVLCSFGEHDRECLRTCGIEGAFVERWTWLSGRQADMFAKAV